MKMHTSTNINAEPSKIWTAITDIKNSADMIKGIIKIEVLEEPEEGIIGLKWKETRLMFGKEAEETMWITDAEENVYYRTRAESHGSVYISELRITPIDAESCELSMTFDGTPTSFFAKLMSAVMMPFFKGSMVKMLEQDLSDIKRFVEESR